MNLRVPEPRPGVGIVDLGDEQDHVVELEQGDLGDALTGDLLLQLGPDVVVPVDVLVQSARFEFEQKRLSDRLGHRDSPSILGYRLVPRTASPQAGQAQGDTEVGRGYFAAASTLSLL